MNAYYTAQELAGLNLQSLPKTKMGVFKKAKKEHWQSRPRSGRGGAHKAYQRAVAIFAIYAKRIHQQARRA